MERWLRTLLGASEHPWAAHLVPSWGAMQVAAMTAAVLILSWRTRGRDRSLLVALAIAFVGAAIGTTLLGGLALLPILMSEGFSAASLRQLTIVAWGALLGLIATYAFVARRQGHEVMRALDLLAPSLGALVLLARLGCFLGGCDFGTVTLRAWSVRFPAGSPAFARHLADGLLLPTDGASLPVHPTQLYESALGLLMLVIALVLDSKRVRAGNVFAASLAVYAAGRWIIELYRGDVRVYGWMTFSQWICLAVVAVLAVATLRRRAFLDSPSGP